LTLFLVEIIFLCVCVCVFGGVGDRKEFLHTQNTTFSFSKIDFTDVSHLVMLHLELILKYGLFHLVISGPLVVFCMKCAHLNMR